MTTFIINGREFAIESGYIGHRDAFVNNGRDTVMARLDSGAWAKIGSIDTGDTQHAEQIAAFWAEHPEMLRG